jgi:hypothetical protein
MARSFPFRTTIIFAALVIAGVVMAVVAPTLLGPTSDRAVLSDVGAALIAGALAFFLVDVTSWERHRAS